MSVQIQGNAGVIVDVSATFRSMYVSHKPTDMGALGHYRAGLQSGLITGTAVAAGSPLFSLRWTDATRFLVLQRLRAYYNETTGFTAAQELGLNAFIARAFTASDSAGTAITLTGNNQKQRTSMGTSLVADMRIAATTLLTAGTRTLDAQAFASTSDTVGTAVAPTNVLQPFEYFADMARGEYPIVLATNEGIVITNTIVFPAAGAARLVVELNWAEVTAF
jgi:hypothetical protein